MMFTRRESAVLLFLCVTLIAGAGVRWYRSNRALLPQPKEDAVVFRKISGELKHNEGPEMAENAVSLEPVSVNLATQEQLERLPGVGPIIAQRIIAYRQQHGPFQSIEDLLHVKGIGNITLNRLRLFIYLE